MAAELFRCRWPLSPNPAGWQRRLQCLNAIIGDPGAQDDIQLFEVSMRCQHPETGVGDIAAAEVEGLQVREPGQVIEAGVGHWTATDVQ